MAQHQWELGWSKEMKRYYFMDKVHGKSTWSRPHGCDLDVPLKPPQDKNRLKSPDAPRDLPKGWKAALDRRPEVNRYYYYRADKPEVRTWYKPVADFEEKVEDPEKIETFTKAILAGAAKVRNFSHALQKLRSESNEAVKKKLTEELLLDVFTANKEFTESSPDVTVSLSTKVTPAEVASKGLHPYPCPLKPFDQMPEVTFAETTLASAALEFWQQDHKREICIVSCCEGRMPPELSFSQETELYCQIPSLMQSLRVTTPSPICPYGPAAYVSANRADAAELSTVVYTPECSIGRTSVSEAFVSLPDRTYCTVPVLCTAAPMRGKAYGLTADEMQKSLMDTLTSIFVEPVLKNPRCTTLILGAWGCEGRFDPAHTEYIATKLAELLSGRKTVEGILIGWLYREVHFCFPKYDAGLGWVKDLHEDPPIEVFKRVFEQHRVNLKLI